MLVERERVGPVEILTLNRPDAANSLNPPLMDELGGALQEVLDDRSARVAVLAAAGQRIFCGGMDLSALESWNERTGSGASGPGRRALAQFLGGTYAKPLIAAVNGAAAGGGLELVMACDLVVAVEHARFGLPEVKRGLYAAGGGTLLAQRIPQALALEMGLTGRMIDAPRALRAGLINQVVAMGDLRTAAMTLAEEVAANGPLAVQLTKRLMRRALEQGADAGRATSDETRVIFDSADAREGAVAFMEKRPAVFVGR